MTGLLVAAVVFPVLAGAATHQVGTLAPGTGFGCPPPDYKYANKFTLAEYGTVSKISGWMKGNGGAGAQSFRTMVYAADGAGGGPGTLLLTSQSVDVAGSTAPGAVDFPVSPAVSLIPGDYWVAQQSGPSTGGTACLSGSGSGLNNFNGDAYGDGPSNPFSASGPIATDPNQWSLSVTYATDDVAPVVTAAVAPPANANGWNSTNVVVTFSCADNAGGSGVGTVTPPASISAEGANQSVTGTCTDKAGNTASVSQTGINIDKSAPAVTFGSHPASYGVDQTVTFGCTASDALSGVAATTCTNTSAPAWSFGAGTHTVAASATDKAGNAATASTTFAVQVSGASLCTLTKQFVQGSAKYQSLNARTKATVDAIWAAACTCVNSIAPRLTASQRNVLVALYKATVTRAAADGWLTSAQAGTLNGLASAL